MLIAGGQPYSTRRLRIYHLRRLASDHPDTGPWQITEDHLLAWMARYQWGPETRRSVRASVRLFYRWAHTHHRIPVDPAVHLPKVAPPRPVPRPAPDAAVEAGLAAADLRTRLAVMILAYTGVRRFEAAKLHSDDLEEQIDGWYLRVAGKGGRIRMVPIDTRLVDLLRQLPPGYVFPGRIDGHLSAHYLGKLVSDALPEGWTAHTLRHRYATLAYSMERDIRAVQELLGHARVTTTQIYTFVPQRSLRVAASGARTGLGAH